MPAFRRNIIHSADVEGDEPTASGNSSPQFTLGHCRHNSVGAQGEDIYQSPEECEGEGMTTATISDAASVAEQPWHGKPARSVAFDDTVGIWSTVR